MTCLSLLLINGEIRVQGKKPRVYLRSLAGLGVRVPTPSQQAPATSPSLAEHSASPAPSRLSELKAGRGRMFSESESNYLSGGRLTSLTRACSSTLTYSFPPPPLLGGGPAWANCHIPTHEQSRSGYKVKSKVIGPQDSPGKMASEST